MQNASALVREDRPGVVSQPAEAPVAPALKASGGDDSSRVRIAVRLRRDTDQRARYWADRDSVSVNEFIAAAVEEKIQRMNGDYDLPTLEQARLNQLIDQMESLSTNVANLEAVTINGFDSLMGLTRGDNYLLDAEDGEIGAEG